MSGEKRPASASFGSTQLVKRQRSESNLRENGSALIQSGQDTSNLQASVMELSGHTGEIFCARFNPSGNLLASGGMDRDILLWQTSGDCSNSGMLVGHKNAVIDLQWSRDGETVYSTGAEAHVASWNATTGQRIRRHEGHQDIINCLDTSKRGEELLVSGSNDCSIGIWDPRRKTCVDYIQTDFPITALSFDEAGNGIFSGSIDNDIKAWDLRTKKVVYTLRGHVDTVTSLALSPDTQSLLSYSYDNTVRTWDIRPFAPTDRAIKVFDGARVGFEQNMIRACWDNVGKKVAAGSEDGSVVIWDCQSGRFLHKLPGHKGMVNDSFLRAPIERCYWGNFRDSINTDLATTKYHVTESSNFVQPR